ncbi:MAG: hypothetical protein COB14_09125 [Alphaproteobacteria bacterium]|nr:MAG: hypothetical protein COB14_09125 [Alphaproteobacteria bacterium]
MSDLHVISSIIHVLKRGPQWQDAPEIYGLAGQVSDYKGAEMIVAQFPPAKHLLADREYDANWFRDVLREKSIDPCIPHKKNRKI